MTNYSLKGKSREQGMRESKRNIFSFEYFEYFQPKIGRTKKDIKPGACFSKVPIINGPGKLSPFTLKTEVSIFLHLTR